MKDDERRFLIDLYNAENTPKGKEFNPIIGELINVTDLPRDIVNRAGFYMHHKRAWYLLEKWSNKGWYDYGTTLDLGWLTDKGKEIAKGLQ